MPRSSHELVFHDFAEQIDQSRNLVMAARKWRLRTFGPTEPRFTVIHKNTLIEIAFLRCCIAWERFLEETFILFLVGKKPRYRRRSPQCYVRPKNRQHAFEMLLPETGVRKYVDWDQTQQVVARAKHYFRDGDPYAPALAHEQPKIEEMYKIRNFIAHRSMHSEEVFSELVRDELSHLPGGLRAGAFLDTVIKGSTPPVTYFDRYLERITRLAQKVVPKAP